MRSRDELLRRIDEAAKHVPLDQPAISPQCGFACIKLGNLLTIDDQRRKLERVVETAHAVWGGPPGVAGSGRSSWSTQPRNLGRC